MNTPSQVRPGQVWADNDPRSRGRVLRVEALVHGRGAKHWYPLPDAGPPTHARCAEGYLLDGRFRPHGNYRPARPSECAWIRIDRFRSTANGYRLIQDVDP